MKNYTYELIPVGGNRVLINKLRVVGNILANSYGSATQLASSKAAEKSKQDGIEYGVSRIY